MPDYILALAIERFSRSGFHVVGIQALLRGTGISKPELYRHFCSKDRLIAACVLVDSDRVARRIDDAGWQKATDLEARVRVILRVLTDEIVDGGRCGLLAATAALEFRNGNAQVREAVERALAILSARLEHAFATFVGDRAADFADRILMLVQGAGMSCVCHGANAAAATLADAALDVARSLSVDVAAMK